MATLDLEKSLGSEGVAWFATTKRVLHALLPTTATVDTPTHLQPLLHKSHQQLPQTRMQSLLNLRAMKKPLSQL